VRAKLDLAVSGARGSKVACGVRWPPLLAIVALGLAACGGAVGGGATAAASVPGSPGPSATAPATSPSAPPPEESSLEVIDFTVNGSIGGQTVAGKLKNTRLTIACMGAGADQILTVHWAGDASSSGTPLQGEIDFKPGTWDLGSSSAEGSATIGLAGGKAADSLVASSGTVTTGSTGGSINAVFDQDMSQLKVAGTWTCP
jgi:hypothetical protein